MILGVVSCSQPKITVNGQSIPESYIDYKIIVRQQFHNKDVSQDIDKKEREEIKETIVEEILLVQHAKKEGIKIDKNWASKVFQKTENNFSSKEDFQEELEKEKITENDIKLEIENTLFLQALKSNMFSEIKVTEKEIEDFYNEHKEDYKIPASYNYSIIVTETKKEAEEAEEAFQKRKEFEKIASDFSYAKSSKVGGLEGWHNENELIPPLKAVLKKMDVGEVSLFIESNWGFLKVKLNKKRSPRQKSLNEVEKDIEQKIKNIKVNENEKNLLKKLKSEADIKGL